MQVNMLRMNNYL